MRYISVLLFLVAFAVLSACTTPVTCVECTAESFGALDETERFCNDDDNQRDTWEDEFRAMYDSTWTIQCVTFDKD